MIYANYMKYSSFTISILICFACLLCSWMVSCRTPEQLATKYPEGYVISAKGDTTVGFVKSGTAFKDQKQIQFFDYFGAKTTYKAGRILGFGYEDQHYLARPIPKIYSDAFSDSLMFMERVVNGPAQLYRFYTRRSAMTLQRGPGYYDIMVKPDQSEYDISYSFRWKRLADAVSDYPALADSIHKDLFAPDQTSLIVDHYNAWYVSQLKASSVGKD